MENLELLQATYISHSFSRHTHETYAIGVILHGAEGFDYRNATHVAPANSIVLINPGEVHTGHAATETGWSYRMLYPEVSLVQKAAQEVLPHTQQVPYFPEPVVQDPQLANWMLDLHRSLEVSDLKLEQDSRLVWTFAQLIRRFAELATSPKPVGQESQAVQQVRDYLEAHYADNISLEELAAIANLSPYYLLRTFRRQVGLPPHGYLNQVRLRHAKMLLRQGHPPVEVATQTGFADQSHLTRQFKRMWGITPGHYQQQSVADLRDE